VSRGLPIGPGQPVYVIGEIGINHNGDLDTALQLMAVAAQAGCNAVKFQKRTPELATPPAMRNVIRETPWGTMTYLDYRRRVELDEAAYGQIARHAADLGIDWFASPWDLPSLAFLEQFSPVAHKIASACLTDLELVRAIGATGRPVIASTGMATIDLIDAAVALLDPSRLVLMHTTSTYPMPPEEADLLNIPALRRRYGVPVGYSGHERGLQISIAAVALGAAAIERHITLDRTMWGSDQAASLEPPGLERLVRDIRIVTQALGDSVKKVHPGELASMKRLRR
jgi:N-acetylneuraminate synthase